MKFKCKECKKEISERKFNGMGLCKKCWRRQNDDKKRDRIRKLSSANYLANREKRIKQSKDWIKRQGEDYQSKRMKKRYVAEKELNLIRQKTKQKFSHLKVACIKCLKQSKTLEFHHLEPFAYDHFQILCRNCHMKAHGRLLAEFKEVTGVIQSLDAPGEKQ